jgi:hypothetical protein
MIVDRTRLRWERSPNKVRSALLSHRQTSWVFPSTDAYRAVRDALVEGGVVEWDPSYERGRRSMRYRLCGEYLTAPLCPVEITGKPARHLTEKLIRSSYETANGLDNVGLYLFSWLRRVRVSRYAKERLKSCPHADDSYRVQLDRLRRLSERRAATWLPLKRDRFGRVHTPVSHWWRGFRRFLTIDGKHLVEIDIRNPSLYC